MSVRVILGLLALSVLSLSGTTVSRTQDAVRLVPQVDHHQHLLSPSLAKAFSNLPAVRGTLEPMAADSLIAQLDAAGIRRALVLSLAYAQGSPSIRGDDEYVQVQRENDWTNQQVALFPDRLRGFCSVNPLRDYALRELDRCASLPNLRYGLKLHLANSQVNLRNPSHVRQVEAVFRSASSHRMAIVVHVWTGRGYGKDEAQVFLDQVMPAAPDIPVQIAHLAGAGPGLDAGSKDALAMFAAAMAAGDPRTANLYFDVATSVTLRTSAEEGAFIAARLRQIGLRRVLYGSDMAIQWNLVAQESWEAFRRMLPLTDTEFRTIADNVAPYMR